MVNRDISESFSKARMNLIIDWPLFGAIIMNLEIVEAKWVSTAATDGKYLYYNKDFILQLDMNELLFVLAHEAEHVIFFHMARRGNRDADLFNMAADYYVNYSLKNDKNRNGHSIGKMIVNKPPVQKCLYDESYTTDLSVEEIYDILKQTNVTPQQTLDVHIFPGDKHDFEHSKDGMDGPIFIPVEEQEFLKEKFQNIVLSTLQNMAGNIPAGLKRLYNTLTKSKIDWRGVLDSEFRSLLTYDYTYVKQSRRRWPGIILPGVDNMEMVHAHIFLDGSGSTTQEMITDCLSEVRGIFTSFQDFEITVATFDTEVYNPIVYTPENGDDIVNYPFKGGGGTRVSSCWDYLKKNDVVPDKIMVFTDGYVGDDWGDKDYAETVFLIHGNKTAVPSHGVTLHYEAKS